MLFIDFVDPKKKKKKKKKLDSGCDPYWLEGATASVVLQANDAEKLLLI